MPTRSLPRTAVLALAGLALAGGALAAVPVRELEARAELDGDQLVYVDVAVGEVRVETFEGGGVEAAATVSCSRFSKRCRTQAEGLTLVTRRRGKTLEVVVGGYPKTNVGGAPKIELRLRMPAALDLEVDLGVGDIEISGVQGDVDVDLGVGDVDLRIDEALVREVTLDVGVGTVDIDPQPEADERSGFLFLGNELRWQPRGSGAEIQIEIGVGAARVRLE